MKQTAIILMLLLAGCKKETPVKTCGYVTINVVNSANIKMHCSVNGSKSVEIQPSKSNSWSANPGNSTINHYYTLGTTKYDNNIYVTVADCGTIEVKLTR